MNVSLTPQLEAMIQEKLETGRYKTASEVVRDALSQMEERDRHLEQFHAAIAVADEQIANGQFIEWTPELRAGILRKAKEAAAAGKQPKPDVVP